jgi:hypothetical protein
VGGRVTRDDDAPGAPIIRVEFRGISSGRFFGLGPVETRYLTDDGLARVRPHLEALPELRELSVDETLITDKGLAHLKGLTQLKLLKLPGREIRHVLMPPARVLSYEAVDDLRKALPQTKVSWPDRLLDDPTIRHRLREIYMRQELGRKN